MTTNPRHIKPLVRKDGLVVKELPEETLVYDTETDRAHCLNETAAFIWKRCDGRTTPAQIARELSGEANVKLDERIVWLAIDQLSHHRLLAQAPTPPPKFSGLNRRQMVRALGFSAAVAIPVITSIVAPSPAQAASCLPGGQQCGTSAQCCSGLCSDGICAST